MSGITNPLTGEEIPDEDIGSLSELCKELNRLEAEVYNLEQQIKVKKERIEYLSTKLIPDKMDQLGMRSLKLTDGTKVEIKPIYSAKLLDGAYTWLDENGHGGLIKTEAIRAFTREQRPEALEFVRENEGFSLKESIHWQTLNAFVKEVYTNNESLPEEHFSVYQGSRTKLSS